MLLHNKLREIFRHPGVLCYQGSGEGVCGVGQRFYSEGESLSESEGESY